jgi:inhibitor of KinA sporulation pathway (predicted exonuclease)
MKIETLKERIEKAELKVSKKQNTISKKLKSIEKKSTNLLNKYGVTYNEEKKLYTNDLTAMGLTQTEASEAYWLQCEIGYLQEDIRRLNKEIPEIQKTIEKYKGQLAGELEKESMFITEVPEAMKQMEVQLVAEWDEWDKARRDNLKKVYQKVGYKAFFKGTPERNFYDTHTNADFEFMYLTDDQIHDSNVKYAREEVLDLYIRVKDVTGEVTDWSNISLEHGNRFPILTGFVVGKEGKASVETILAGGYNIQRLHIRTLVHSI